MVARFLGGDARLILRGSLQSRPGGEDSYARGGAFLWLLQEFATCVEYARSLAFHDTPDYDDIRRILRELFVRAGF